MFKRSLEIQVGIFISAAFIILIVALTSLEDGGISFFRPRYKLNMKVDSVEGLGPGSLIQILGVPAGNVKEINIMPDNEVLVVLNLYKEFQPMVTKGSKAFIKTQGALGDMFVLIKPENNQNGVLRNGDFIEVGANTGILAAFSKDNSPLETLSDVLNNIKLMLEKINSEESEGSSVLNNLEGITRELKILLKSINDVLNDVSKDELRNLLSDLSKVIKKIEMGEGTLGAIINDPTIHSQIKTFLGASKGDKYVSDIIKQSIENSKE